MKRIEKVESMVSNALNYPVWIIKEGKEYKIQKINDGSFLTQYNKTLLFKNLNEIIKYIEK